MIENHLQEDSCRSERICCRLRGHARLHILIPMLVLYTLYRCTRVERIRYSSVLFISTVLFHPFFASPFLFPFFPYFCPNIRRPSPHLLSHSSHSFLLPLLSTCVLRSFQLVSFFSPFKLRHRSIRIPFSIYLLANASSRCIGG